MAKVTFKSQLPAHVVSGWQPKALGPLPTEAQLQVAHCFSQRFGLEAFAGMACALRDGGVSAKVQRLISHLWSQGKSSGTHKNKIDTQVEGGYFAYVGDNRRQIKITPEGQKRLDAYVANGGTQPKAAPAKPAKGKANDPVAKSATRHARKAARKATRKPADAPVMTAAPAEQGAPNDGGGAAQPQG